MPGLKPIKCAHKKAKNKNCMTELKKNECGSVLSVTPQNFVTNLISKNYKALCEFTTN